MQGSNYSFIVSKPLSGLDLLVPRRRALIAPDFDPHRYLTFDLTESAAGLGAHFYTGGAPQPAGRSRPLGSSRRFALASTGADGGGLLNTN